MDSGRALGCDPSPHYCGFWGSRKGGTSTATPNTTRGALLAVLYGNVGESFYSRQLARRTVFTLGAVQRELRRLVDAGLVTRKTLGSQTFYSANQASPVFEEMRSLVTKTVGVHDVLLEALRPLEKKINIAFVYGSLARSGEHAASDVI